MAIAGRTAVVTGGGQGIGAAIGDALAAAGVRVVLAARSVDRLEQRVSAIRTSGGEAWAIPCDVRKSDSVAALAREALVHLGSVDILVNNAGIALAAPLHRLTLAEWEGIFAVNTTGTFLCTQAFLPGMLERRQGRVINIASTAGLTGAKYISAYAASKHAVIGFTRAMAAEVAAAGVTVNAVCPGYVDTEMTERSTQRIREKTGRSQAEALEAILDTTPQHRLIHPAEVAHAVVALCDNKAAGINGQAIVIDGGALLA